MDKSGIHTTVTKYPDCDMCKIDFRLPDIKINAYYDAPTVYGSQAYMCRTCYLKYRMHDKLGVGLGQQFLLERQTLTTSPVSFGTGLFLCLEFNI